MALILVTAKDVGQMKNGSPISIVENNYTLNSGSELPTFYVFEITDADRKKGAYLACVKKDENGNPLLAPTYNLPYWNIFTQEQLESILESPDWVFLKVKLSDFIEVSDER